MKTITIIAEIKVDDENISNLYPNYKFNWDSPEEFMQSLVDDIETPIEEDGAPVNYLKSYGYSIKVLTRDEAKLIDIMEDKD